MAARFFIGTSGWHYDWWRGLFYPPQLPKSRWLEFYSQHFSTVELNNSFYRLPSEAAFANWKDSSPPGFLFAVKVSRLITHLKKLRNAETALQNFLARARLLGAKLGPLLYQLPPNMHRNAQVLEEFLKLLPPDLEHVFEFRDRSWLHEDVFDLLRRYKAGFCAFDMPGLTTPLVATASFGYIRFHGSSALYSSFYSDEELESWAQRTRQLAQRLERCYIYFNNDTEGFAVQNAKTLAARLSASSDRGA